MARPQKTTVDYFPHFTETGKTLFIIEQKYGNDGYAVWFKLLQLLGKSDNLVYDTRNSFDWEFLSAKTRVNESLLRDILNTLAKLEAINPELWEIGLIWSCNFAENVGDAFKRRTVERPTLERIKQLYGISASINPDKEGLCEHNADINGVSADIYSQRESKVYNTKEKIPPRGQGTGGRENPTRAHARTRIYTNPAVDEDSGSTKANAHPVPPALTPVEEDFSLSEGDLAFRDSDFRILPEEKVSAHRKPGWPPSVEDIQNFAISSGLDLLVSMKFFRHYEKRNWRYSGGDKVTNWQERLVNWCRNEKKPLAAAKPDPKPKAADLPPDHPDAPFNVADIPELFRKINNGK